MIARLDSREHISLGFLLPGGAQPPPISLPQTWQPGDPAEPYGGVAGTTQWLVAQRATLVGLHNHLTRWQEQQGRCKAGLGDSKIVQCKETYMVSSLGRTPRKTYWYLFSRPTSIRKKNLGSTLQGWRWRNYGRS